ncbi:Semaphorin-2A [Eumeta japonica]|uniref:Semaphorin-2A n=1 Tax=Eumeta variegata TaxID=151549 RepID=A0A4C1ZWD4_EUMVA|nr:Semaphorin-2A [Eumeta japonica]
MPPIRQQPLMCGLIGHKLKTDRSIDSAGLILDHVREFSCGTLYYRTFFVDSKRDSLYVGAMDRLYRLNMNNISASHCERDSINLEPSNVAQCVSKGKSEILLKQGFQKKIYLKLAFARGSARMDYE